jgi:hypothetical protein
MDDPERLEVVRLDLDPGLGGFGVEVDPFDADELGEVAGRDLRGAQGRAR